MNWTNARDGLELARLILWIASAALVVGAGAGLIKAVRG